MTGFLLVAFLERFRSLLLDLEDLHVVREDDHPPGSCSFPSRSAPFRRRRSSNDELD
jgi:hypothetical protein